MNKSNLSLSRMQEVINKVGIARSTVWYMVKKGKLPRARKLSPRVTILLRKILPSCLCGCSRERRSILGRDKKGPFLRQNVTAYFINNYYKTHKVELV